jgi:hypothetical protein
MDANLNSHWFMYPESQWSPCKLGLQPRNIASDLEYVDRTISTLAQKEHESEAMDTEEFLIVERIDSVLTADHISKMNIFL